MDRRRFLTSSLAAAGIASLPAAAAQSDKPERKTSMASSPILLATWDFGLKAVETGYATLQNGGSVVDVVEAAAKTAEDDPNNTSVGYGGYPNELGVVQLDAAIIDGKSGRMGSVAALEDIRNPISVARRVMEKGKHILLVGEGAKRFAMQEGFKPENLLTPNASAWYSEQLKKRHAENEHDTIGVLARDANGEMAVACTTSGLGMKWAGRVGDSPLIGAGLYLDAEVGGAVGTGVGERAIELCAAFAIVELMRNGRSPQEACQELMRRVAKRNQGREPFQLAFMALGKDGDYGAAAMQTGFQYALSINGEQQIHPGKVYRKDFE